ncbi:MAG: 2-oxo acid dehydrogenase subunit E2 [Alphaproteobacteria bacterium]|nr:2-oxo acid dehydrogenase subunit E2 [Alphaproteobacteria bacterium]
MDVIMPQLGETVEEGTVSIWHKKVGDQITEGEDLFDVSTDKVEMEIPAPASGELVEIRVAEGETVDVGVTLAVISDGAAATATTASAATAPAASAEAPESAAPAAMDVIMPQLGETVEEGTVSVWHKKVGDHVEAGEDLFDVSTDKVEMEIPAPASGELIEIRVAEGETVAVGVTLAVIGGGAATAPAVAAEKPAPATPVAATPAPAAASTRKVSLRDARGNPLSPVVRRLIAENALTPEDITGTGRAGRITRKDVLAFLDGKGAQPAAPVTDARTPVPASKDGRTVVPFDKIRKLTAEHMVRSKATSPHVLQAVEVDFHSVERARLALREVWKQQYGFSLTYLPFIAKAVCEAIAEYPRINAHVEGESLVLFDQINLGIAVDLNFEGLVVPVVKNAGVKSIAELAKDIRALSDKARNKKLGPDDMAGGTYTISNSGTFGTLITAPVISQPQVAILSMDGVSKKPVVIDVEGSDAIAIHPVGVLAQSFDHRAIDGAYSAAFLKKVRECLQDNDWRVDLA